MARRIAADPLLRSRAGLRHLDTQVLAYRSCAGELPMTPFGWRLMGSTVPGMGADRLTPMGTALAWLLSDQRVRR